MQRRRVLQVSAYPHLPLSTNLPAFNWHARSTIVNLSICFLRHLVYLVASSRSPGTVLINNRSGFLKAYWFAMSAFNYSSEHIHYDMHLFCIWTGDSQPSVELIWISLELFNHAKAPCIASQCLPTSPVVDKLASIQLTRQIYNSKFVNMFSETFGVFGCKFSITGDSWKCNCVFIWPSF